MNLKTEAISTIWVVFQEGVYRHLCGGIFTTKSKAEAAALKLASQDRDSYHEWHVVPFEIDVMVTDEKDSVFECNKKSAKARIRN
jgi:hypothetical protein